MAAPYISTVAELSSYLQARGLSWQKAHLPPPDVFKENFNVRIPVFYANLIDWADPNDPLRLMSIPTEAELDVKEYELFDPIGDHTHEPVHGLIHRYPDRCLLLLTTHCTVHCRFCFRRDVIGKPTLIDFKGIFPYLKNHQEIREVIFSGGDPATLPASYLGRVLDELALVPHLTTVRFHSRAMVVDPTSITEPWLQVIRDAAQLSKVVVLHINHPREITPQLRELAKKLLGYGVLLFSQSVLLKGINNDADTLRELFRDLAVLRITPYYLHHLDKARGTHHFRVSIAEGRQLFTQLRGTIPGYAVPEYVVDLPGGDGKVPVMWLRPISAGKYEVENFLGKTIIYQDPISLGNK